MKTIRVGLIVAPRKFDDLKTSIFDLQASLLLVSKKKIYMGTTISHYSSPLNFLRFLLV